MTFIESVPFLIHKVYYNIITEFEGLPTNQLKVTLFLGTICIKNVNFFAQSINIGVGLPQGFILSPPLFLIYINDLPNAISSKPRLFADDICMMLSVSSRMEVSRQVSVSRQVKSETRLGEKLGSRSRSRNCVSRLLLLVPHFSCLHHVSEEVALPC